MKTLDRLDHEEARQALALFSQMEVAAKGRDAPAILGSFNEHGRRDHLARMRTPQGG